MTEIGAQRVWQSCHRQMSTDSSIKSFFLRLGTRSLISGQHVDVRLTAPDGYTACSYSSLVARFISDPQASAPHDGEIPFFMILQQRRRDRTPWAARWPFLWRSLPTANLIGAGSACAADGDDPPAPIPGADGPSCIAPVGADRPRRAVLGELHSVKRTIQHSAWLWRSPRAPLRASDDASASTADGRDNLPSRPKPFAVFVRGSNGFVNITGGQCALQASTPQSSRL